MRQQSDIRQSISSSTDIHCHMDATRVHTDNVRLHQHYYCTCVAVCAKEDDIIHNQMPRIVLYCFWAMTGTADAGRSWMPCGCRPSTARHTWPASSTSLCSPCLTPSQCSSPTLTPTSKMVQSQYPKIRHGSNSLSSAFPLLGSWLWHAAIIVL